MITRRNFMILGAQAVASIPFLRATGVRAEALSQLVFAGPPAPLSIPLARLAKLPELTDKVPDVQMEIWRTPDIMRSQMLSGEIDVTAAPVNAAAILYNKGIRVRLMDANNGGILSLLTSNPAVKEFTDLKGKKVLLFFRGDIPDMIFRFLALKKGMNPDSDMEISYVESPFEALQMLLSGRADNVLLSEPPATAAMLKGKQAGKSFHRIILQDIWTEVTGSTLPLPPGRHHVPGFPGGKNTRIRPKPFRLPFLSPWSGSTSIRPRPPRSSHRCSSSRLRCCKNPSNSIPSVTCPLKRPESLWNFIFPHLWKCLPS